jgi:hypothetical protein
MARRYKPRDLSDVQLGTRFAQGQLLVIDHVQRWRHTQYRTLCVCLCACGTVFETLPQHLRDADTTSCGCQKAARAHAWQRQRWRDWRAGRLPGYPNGDPRTQMLRRWHADAPGTPARLPHRLRDARTGRFLRSRGALLGHGA